jgi:phosphate transport system permease protein
MIESTQSHSAPTPQALRIAKLQRIQDFLFHAITQFFALSVLIALLGIMISLVSNAWPSIADQRNHDAKQGNQNR